MLSNDITLVNTSCLCMLVFYDRNMMLATCDTLHYSLLYCRIIVIRGSDLFQYSSVLLFLIPCFANSQPCMMCLITIGAISIGNMMMVNHSLEELNMSFNNIDDGGISAIARGLGNCKINKLYVSQCGITVTGARSLVTALSSHPTIRELSLQYNHISVEGAQQILEAAVNNTVTLNVYIDYEYKNDKVKEMLSILENRREHEVRDYVM